MTMTGASSVAARPPRPEPQMMPTSGVGNVASFFDKNLTIDVICSGVTSGNDIVFVLLRQGVVGVIGR
jgi:hypothetical protein